MKTLAFVIASVLVVAGCKKGGDCAKAIDKSMEVAKLPDDAKTQAKMRELAVQHCKDDKWSDDVLTCMTSAKSEAEAQGCYGKLSKDQQDKMNKAVMDMMSAGGAPS